MKVLFIEVSVPIRYNDDKAPIAGWQDSLEYLLRKHSTIELGVAFEAKSGSKNKVIDGVSYFPICPDYSFMDKLKNKFSWNNSRNILIPLAEKLIKNFKPDIVHVFGSEWCWGQVAKYVNVPVVIHMQGSIPSYYNALYPPKYSELDMVWDAGLNIKRQIDRFLSYHKNKSWKAQEENTLKDVNYYMGRTDWDHNIIKLYNPSAKYFYCSEALRPTFIESQQEWRPQTDKKIKLTTIGCGSFWKGCDTILRAAHLLNERNIDFEWIVAGKMPMQNLIENKEKLKYENEKVRLVGFLEAEPIKELLLNSDLYIHTAYIDNSPNAICEAQWLGLPIIATYVGGIPSLIENMKDGILIPANDPYTLAETIIELSLDKDRQVMLGKSSRNRALVRHNTKNILNDLLICYSKVIADYKNY